MAKFYKPKRKGYSFN